MIRALGITGLFLALCVVAIAAGALLNLLIGGN